MVESSILWNTNLVDEDAQNVERATTLLPDAVDAARQPGFVRRNFSADTGMMDTRSIAFPVDMSSNLCVLFIPAARDERRPEMRQKVQASATSHG